MTQTRDSNMAIQRNNKSLFNTEFWHLIWPHALYQKYSRILGLGCSYYHNGQRAHFLLYLCISLTSVLGCISYSAYEGRRRIARARADIVLFIISFSEAKRRAGGVHGAREMQLKLREDKGAKSDAHREASLGPGCDLVIGTSGGYRNNPLPEF